ncbi:hypothetical protein NHX12_013376 [Muraenolepis orangiensis]|uniref:PDZ domain-containing protein n=1 Tax=Muraenolepis orangiensis TaxID=630683 RepID=A0A9Q0DHB0_9TELE|nr:hypothetical protein NHX12_013376 [Muraenolepis orangiensis]
MAKVIQKKHHWITRVNECAMIRDDGALRVALLGGAENGQFSYIGHPLPGDAVVYQSGELHEGELLLEVGGLPVPGLPTYDILSVIESCKGAVRFKTVRQEYTPKSDNRPWFGNEWNS